MHRLVPSPENTVVGFYEAPSRTFGPCPETEGGRFDKMRVRPEARTWHVFKLPAATAHVPAESEEAARAILRANCYPNAPVGDWPCLGTIRCTREELTQP